MVYSKKNERRLLSVVIIILAVISGVIFMTITSRAPIVNDLVTVEINGHIIRAELAQTPEEHYRGLSNREALDPDRGLLFIFEDSSRKSFVMREMNFPLDIIFISNDTITDVFSDLVPEGSQPENIYQSSQPVNLVLEVRAGYCQAQGIKPGDQVKIY